MRVRVYEIFASIQGEGLQTGYPFAFVRLAGCNLRCVYCDTRRARTARGTSMGVGTVVRRVRELRLARVLITGGEPLAQDGCAELAAALLADGRSVTVETNGSLDVSVLPAGCRIVLDVKTPGSGEADSTDLANLDRLGPSDEIKFVLVDRADYEWSRALVAEHGLIDRGVVVHFAPAAPALDGTMLADWIVADRLPVRLNLQLHKVLWPLGEPKNA
jgi:7-carboxy-7-deazaguanine synthase